MSKSQATTRRQLGRNATAALVVLTSAITAIAVNEQAVGATDALLGICPFPISHAFPKLHGLKGHDLPGPARYLGMDTGQVTVVVTNLTNGKAATAAANSASFGVDDFHAYFRGQSVTFFDSQRGIVPKGVFVTDGNEFVTQDADGHVIAVSGTAKIRRDICQEIA